MSEHTKEPWRLIESEEDCNIESDTVPVVAATFSSSRCLDEEQHANARRIVACVNALKDVPTEWLEQNKSIVVLGAPIADRFRALEQQSREAMQELRNIADAKRFDRICFSSDDEFASWAQSRARFTLQALEQLKEKL